MDEKIYELFDEKYSKELIVDFGNSPNHGICGYNFTKNIRNIIKLEYNTEVITKNYGYMLKNGKHEISINSNGLRYDYIYGTYKNILITIVSNRTDIEYMYSELNRFINFNNICKILYYRYSTDRVRCLIFMSHIFNNLLNIRKIDTMKVLENLSNKKIYTRQEIINLGIGEISIGIDKQKIPIIEEISEDQYIFYSNNFKKYINIIQEEYSI